MPARPDLQRLLSDDLAGRFDPDSPAARASLERILLAPPLTPERRPRRLAYAALPAAAAAGGIVAVASLGGSGSSLAEAAVLSRATAALEQSGAVVHLQVQAHGGAALNSQEWISPDGSRAHTIYGNGDETVDDGAAHEFQAYDAAHNTLTTITDSATSAVDPAGSQLADPYHYEQLYRLAESDVDDVTLVGQTTVNGESTYELRFAVHQAHEIDVYLDSRTFTPVRSVDLLDGNVIASRDVVVERLPDTQANEGLLAMSAHPGAARIEETETQDQAEIAAKVRALSNLVP
jgi:hypothetical protein